MRRAAALAAAFGLAACGRDPQPAATAAPSERRTVVFRHGRVTGFEAFFRQVIEGFERRNPGVRVVDETMPWDPGQQHQLYALNLADRSSAFDVLGLDIVWIAEFTRAGWLHDLTPWFTADARSRFLPAAVGAAATEGGTYAIPWFTDAGLLYYRRDLLEKHGHAPPGTWDDLVRVSKDVLAKEKDPQLAGFVWQGRRYEGLVCGAMEYLASNGVRVVDDAGRWAVDDAAATEALQTMADLIYKHRVTPALVLTADEEVTRQIFGDGRALFMRNWPYAYGLFAKPGSVVQGKVGIAPLPHFAGHSSAGALGGWFLGVNKFSKDPELAFRFAEYLSSPEVQKMMFARVGYLPTRTALYRDPELLAHSPHLASLETILSGARARPVTPDYMSLSSILQNEVSAVVSGVKTPKKAVAAMRSQAKPLLDKAAGRP